MIFQCFFNPHSGSTHSDSQNVSAISDDYTINEEFFIDINDGKESCALFILFIKMYLQTLFDSTSRYTLRNE